MNVTRRITGGLRAVARPAVAAFRAREWRDGLAVFNYHQVSPSFDSARHLRATWTSLADFDRQLDAIASRFAILPLARAIDGLKAGTLRGRCASITFDDGDLTLGQHVVPLLERKRIPATCFINTAYADGVRPYWVYTERLLDRRRADARGLPSGEEIRGWTAELRTTRDPARYAELRERVESLIDGPEPPRPYLVTHDDLRSLDPELIAIGPHGHEHQRFAMMPDDWQRRCVETCARRLAELPGYVPIFAIPFGRSHDYDDRVLDACRDLGLDVVSADGGLNRTYDGACRRLPADGRDAIDLFRRELTGW